MFVSIVRSHLLCRKDLGTGSSNHILPFAIGLFFIAEIGGTKQFMSRKKKNRVYVGLDGLDIKVNTTKILEQNYYIFYNKNNDEIGHLQAVKDSKLKAYSPTALDNVKEVYEIAVDAYKQTHKLSYLLLHRALKSVLKKLPEECVIYLLMQEMSMVEHKTKI